MDSRSVSTPSLRAELLMSGARDNDEFQSTVGVGEETVKMSGAIRKRTPVFQDLNTAYSSITSRTPKFDQHYTSKKTAPVVGMSIPLQDMSPATNSDIPLALPPPIVISHGCPKNGSVQPMENSQIVLGNHHKTDIPVPTQPPQDQSLEEVSKHAELELPESVQPESEPVQASTKYIQSSDSLDNYAVELDMPPGSARPSTHLTCWPRNSLELKNGARTRSYSRLHQEERLSSSDVEVQGVALFQDLLHNQAWDESSVKGSRFRSNEAATECSTVGNIYMHYEQSQGVGDSQTFEYGDDSISSHGKLSDNSLLVPEVMRPINSNNPYRKDMPPTMLVSSVDKTSQVTAEGHTASNERLPLEREVSQALRRASGYSMYSIDSMNVAPLKVHKTILSETTESNTSGSAGTRFSIDGRGSNPQAHQQGDFYNATAIPPNWVASRHRNDVRIPIHRNEISPPEPSTRRPSLTIGHHGEGTAIEGDGDANDWETVADSLDTRGDPQRMYGFKTTGSSIADTSDTSSSFVEVFGSTERIAQHPGSIDFAGDYRQRDMMRNNMPVLLPVYGDHKVNGYLNDSMRLKPRANLYQTPTPLAIPHNNPFKTPPPAVTESRNVSKAKPIPFSFKSRTKNHFPPSRTLDTIESVEQSSPLSLGTPPSALLRNSSIESKPSPNNEYGISFSDPGSSFVHRNSPQTNLRPFKINPERSSWQYITDHALNRYTEEARGNAGQGSYVSVNGDFVEVSLDTSNPDGKCHSRTASNRLPPGAFYRGIRSSSMSQKPKTAVQGASKQVSRIERNILKSQPTNVLRPLSLVSAEYMCRPATGQSTPTHKCDKQHFTFRSPLAPPRENWRALYTSQQMNDFKESAKADGVYESSEQLSCLHGAASRPDIARRRVSDVPRLFQWSRESTHLTTSINRKRRISNVFLALCAIFPPFLVLYCTGYLDCLMAWWTNNEFVAFGHGQKKFAKRLGCCWFAFIISALVTMAVLGGLGRL